MRTFLLTGLAALTLACSSCMKHAEDHVPDYGTAPNTWTFTDGERFYFGEFGADAVLHTTPQNNNTFTFEMTGSERTTGEKLTMALSLADSDFSQRCYQSGVIGSDHQTAFYYSGAANSSAAIYASSNNSPGAIMQYQVVRYDPSASSVTIRFEGEVFDAGGDKTNIRKGKLTARFVRR